MKWTKFPKHLRPLKHWPIATRHRVETLVQEYSIIDPPGLLLLQTFANAESREIECRDQIEKDGATVIDRYGQTKPHPLLSAERDARSQKLAALKALHFDFETVKKPGRPASGLGV